MGLRHDRAKENRPMNASSLYALPALVGEQYVLSSVLRETPDTVLYAATQKDMRRDVVVETLKPEAASDPVRVQQFLETAKAQAQFCGNNIAASLELLYAEGTWHMAKERIRGEALDAMLERGGKLPSAAVCELMLHLCRICVGLDIEKIANLPFALQNVYAVGMEFRFDNLACAGERSRSASRRMLTDAAKQAALLLEPESPFAEEVGGLLERMRLNANWSMISPLLFDEEFARLQLGIWQVAAPAR